MKKSLFTPFLLLISVSIAFAQVTPFTAGAGWTFNGPLAFTAFGWSMTTAGDVNGDGFEDMIVSAIDYSNPIETEEEEGRLYLFYGGPEGLSETPAWSYESNQTLTVLGFCTSGGDLNGDGYSDIVAGGLQWSGDFTDEGKVFLWYGSPTGPNPDEPDWTLTMGQESALFGSGCAMDGDLNGDGYNDLFVAAKQWNGPEQDEGKVWLYWGSADGPVYSGWSYEPNQEFAICGFPVNYAGDVNSDGYEDVVISVNAYDVVQENDGLVVLFYGGPGTPSATPDWTATSGQKKSNFGHWSDGAGDVNGDGYDDVIVAAINYEDILAEGGEGRVFVYHGGPDGPSASPDWFGETNQMSANLGYCAAAAGDINNDGYADVVAGAKYYDNDYFDEGSAHVWFGGPDGLETEKCWDGYGAQDNAYYGRFVGGACDFNNDGYDDFMVGAYRYTELLEADGKGFVYYGGPRQSDFNYGSDVLCLDAVTALPTIEGISGGTFFAPEAVISPTTGAINLAATGVGTFDITYTAPGSCPSTITISIEDASAIDWFDYESDTYCIDYTPIIPTVAEGGSGYFMADGVTVDSLTGEILADSTMAGTHTIYYVVTTDNGCPFIDSTIITLLPITEISFTDLTFCRDDAFTIATVNNPGGVFSSDSVVINATTGVVDLLASEVGGPFMVYYTAMAYCPQASTIMYIDSADHAMAVFAYGDDSLCTNEIGLYPTEDPVASGGVYSADGLSIDPVSGFIDPAFATPGAYTIEYTAMWGACQISYATTMYILEGVDATFSYDADMYFQLTANPSPIAVDPSGIYYAIPEGLVIDELSGEIDLTLSDTGTYIIFYTVENDFCADGYTDTITIMLPCVAPDPVTVSDITFNSVLVSWTPVDGYTEYIVSVEGPTTNYYTVSDDQYLVTGLDPETSYIITVYTKCTESDSAAAEEVNVMTEKELGVEGLYPLIGALYPNPTTGVVTCAFRQPIYGSICLYDTHGVLISCEILNGVSTYQYDLQQVPNGMYLMRVKDAQGEASQLVVKQE